MSNDYKRACWDGPCSQQDMNEPGFCQCEAEFKQRSHLERENAVLHARVRQLETEKEEHVWALTRALWNCRATAILEQEKPSGAHLTAFSLIQKYATEALGDGGLE